MKKSDRFTFVITRGENHLAFACGQNTGENRLMMHGEIEFDPLAIGISEIELERLFNRRDFWITNDPEG